MKSIHVGIICVTILVAAWIFRPTTPAPQPGGAAVGTAVVQQQSASDIEQQRVAAVERERAAANERERIEKERAAAAQRERERMSSEMRSVMQRDNELAKVRAANLPVVNKMKDVDTLASVTQVYVTALKSVNMSACPRDFVAAYYRHIAAWQSQVTALVNHPQDLPDGFEGFLYGALRGLQGDITGGVADYQKETKAWLRQVQATDAPIQATWGEVQAFVAEYGAK